VLRCERLLDQQGIVKMMVGAKRGLFEIVLIAGGAMLSKAIRRSDFAIIALQRS